MSPSNVRCRRTTVVKRVSVVVLSVVLIGLIVRAGHAMPAIELFAFSTGANVNVQAGPGFKRQSNIVTGALTVTSDVDYRIDATVKPPEADWMSVYMNAGGHGGPAGQITSDAAWGLGFDIAITLAGNSVFAPSVAACGQPGGWCMGHASLEHAVAMTGVPETNHWEIHVRLVLVDEADETAGYNTIGDNVRFASLPSDASRSVDVEIVVSEP